MPALVNSSVGSSSGTTLLDGTNVWPCFLTKKSMNCWRISLAVRMSRIRPRLLDNADRRRVAVHLAIVGLDAGENGHHRCVDCPGDKEKEANTAGDDNNYNQDHRR